MRFLILAILAICAILPAQSQRVLLNYQSGAKADVLAKLLEKGFEIDYDWPDINALAVRPKGKAMYSPSAKPATAAEVSSVAGIPRVLGAEVDGIVQKHACAGDGNVYGGAEFIPYGLVSTQANLSHWDTRQAAVKSNILYCVVDDGLDTSHPDIGASVNTLTGSNTPYAWNNPAQPHGTHVSGTILAASGNSCSNCGSTNGIVGVVKGGANLYMNNVFGSGNGATVSDIINGWTKCRDYFITWKGSNTARKMVINNSLGGGNMGTTAGNTINSLYNRGDVLVFASSGNSGSQQASYPAAYTNAISVAATDVSNTRASFSTYHSTVEISAPGVAVVSTLHKNFASAFSVAGSNLVSSLSGATFDPNPQPQVITGSNTGSASNKQFMDCGLGTSPCTGASGRICLIQRGTNSFCEKMLNCKSQGGVAALIYNNAADACAPLTSVTLVAAGSGCENANNNIPTVGVSRAQGEALKAAIAAGTVTGTVSGSSSAGGQYAAWDGTSMSCPHATAVAGLVWAQFPACKGPRIREAMQKSALDKGAAGRDKYYGFGVIQAKAMFDWLTTNGC